MAANARSAIERITEELMLAGLMSLVWMVLRAAELAPSLLQDQIEGSVILMIYC